MRHLLLVVGPQLGICLVDPSSVSKSMPQGKPASSSPSSIRASLLAELALTVAAVDWDIATSAIDPKPVRARRGAPGLDDRRKKLPLLAPLPDSREADVIVSQPGRIASGGAFVLTRDRQADPRAGVCRRVS